MLRAFLRSGNERQADARLHHAGKLDLCLLSGFTQPLKGLTVLPQVDAFLLLKLISDVVYYALIPVIAAELCVTCRGLYLKNAFPDFQNRYIERAAAQVVDQNRLVLFLIQPVRQRRGCGFVDDTQDLQPGDLSRGLGGRSLGIVEIGRDGDNCVRHLVTQICLRVRLQFLKDHRGNLFRGESVVVNSRFEIAAHLPLYR